MIELGNLQRSIVRFSDVIARFGWTQFRTTKGTTGAVNESGKKLYGAQAQRVLAGGRGGNGDDVVRGEKPTPKQGAPHSDIPANLKQDDYAKMSTSEQMNVLEKYKGIDFDSMTKDQFVTMHNHPYIRAATWVPVKGGGNLEDRWIHTIAPAMQYWKSQGVHKDSLPPEKIYEGWKASQSKIATVKGESPKPAPKRSDTPPPGSKIKDALPPGGHEKIKAMLASGIAKAPTEPKQLAKAADAAIVQHQQAKKANPLPPAVEQASKQLIAEKLPSFGEKIANAVKGTLKVSGKAAEWAVKNTARLVGGTILASGATLTHVAHGTLLANPATTLIGFAAGGAMTDFALELWKGSFKTFSKLGQFADDDLTGDTGQALPMDQVKKLAQQFADELQAEWQQRMPKQSA